jgi:hypothetical protein
VGNLAARANAALMTERFILAAELLSLGQGESIVVILKTYWLPENYTNLKPSMPCKLP